MTNAQAARAILADPNATPIERRGAIWMLNGIETPADQDAIIIAEYRGEL